MCKWLILIITALLVYWQPAKADLAADVEWITNHSHYNYNGQPLPDVRVLTEKEWRQRIGIDTIVATFMPNPPTIVLRGEQGPSVQVHELVHYLQYLRGDFDNPYFCAGELEPDAYLIEAQWLKAHNLVAPMPDPLWIMVMASRCRSPHRFGVQ